MIIGMGDILFSHKVKGSKLSQVTQLSPVYHIQELKMRLLSADMLLNQGYQMEGEKGMITFFLPNLPDLRIECYTKE